MFLISRTFYSDLKKKLNVNEDMIINIKELIKKDEDSDTKLDKVLEYCDKILKTHGVEYLPSSRKTLRYCNTGDPYNTTVMFYGNMLRVGNWGDLAERYIV